MRDASAVERNQIAAGEYSHQETKPGLTFQKGA
jgi:hypothetical protein